MIPSARIATFIQGFETCTLVAMKPTANDQWTVGWGETGPHIIEGTTWTQEYADQSFANRLAGFGVGVSGLIKSATNQNQFDALTSFSYNEGLGHLAGSTLLRLHNAGDYAGAADQFSQWDLQAGVVLGGLARRRAAERMIYLEAA